MTSRTDYNNMQQLDLSSYQKVNGSFRRRLIYHAGIDCGFCVELNYMINAMLYCLAKGYRFQLYSEDANFGTGKGWTEYFDIPKTRTSEQARAGRNISNLSARKFTRRFITSTTCIVHRSGIASSVIPLKRDHCPSLLGK